MAQNACSSVHQSRQRCNYADSVSVRPRYSLTEGGPDGDDLLALLEVARPTWHRLAACRGNGPEGHFPQHPDPPTGLAACADCPVRLRCLVDALEGPTWLVGVWGGLGHVLIRRLRRALASLFHVG